MGKHLKTPVSIRFTEAELALLKEMAAIHGGQSGAVMAGLKALKERRNALSVEEALSLLADQNGFDLKRRRIPKGGGSGA